MRGTAPRKCLLEVIDNSTIYNGSGAENYMPLNGANDYIDSEYFSYSNGILTAKKAATVAIFYINFGVIGYSECSGRLVINGNIINSTVTYGSDYNIRHGYNPKRDTTWGDGTLVRYNLSMSQGNTIGFKMYNNVNAVLWRCAFIYTF